MAFAVKSKNFRRTTPRRLIPARWVYPRSGRFDASAATAIAAVIAAGGTLTGAQQTAINSAVVAMKAAGIWTKLYRWWPIVGGNSSGHLIDFKTGTSQATNVNSPTHSATGVKSNGTTSYISTTVTPNDLGATGSLGVTFKTEPDTSIRLPIGSESGTDTFEMYFSIGSYHYYGKTNFTTFTGSGYKGVGNHAVVRESSTVLKSMKNGSVNNTLTTATTVGASAVAFFLLARNASGTPGGFVNVDCTNFWMGTTLVEADIATLSGIITTLETAFGR